MVLGSSSAGGGGAGASMAAPWRPTSARRPAASANETRQGFLLRGRHEVGNSPRVVLGGGGAWKTARDGETSASNSSDSVSLLHGSSSFISRSYDGDTTSSCLVSSRRCSRGTYTGAVVVTARAKAAAQSLRPKRAQGGCLYRGILQCADGGFLQPTLPRIQARFNRFGLDLLRDKTDLIFGLNSTTRGRVRLGKHRVESGWAGRGRAGMVGSTQAG
jgi:hypothetical protein